VRCIIYFVSDLQLLAMCMDLFMAGSETTSNTLSIFMSAILKYPDVQAKIQDEIDRVVGKEKLPSAADRPRFVIENRRDWTKNILICFQTALCSWKQP
jgi:cytochrome P450